MHEIQSWWGKFSKPTGSKIFQKNSQNDKNIIYNDLLKPKIIDKICKNKNEDLKIEYCGSFVFGPLGHNFGLTVGNALRRIILSSSYGIAVIGFRRYLSCR